jgi:hypothetical protein
MLLFHRWVVVMGAGVGPVGGTGLGGEKVGVLLEGCARVRRWTKV